MPWRTLVASSPRLYRLVPVEPTDTLPAGDYVVAGEGAADLPETRFRVAADIPVAALRAICDRAASVAA